MENIFTVKSIVAQELAEVYGYIENRIKDYNTKYDVVEILDEQETHWKTGEPLWEDASDDVMDIVRDAVLDNVSIDRLVEQVENYFDVDDVMDDVREDVARNVDTDELTEKVLDQLDTDSILEDVAHDVRSLINADVIADNVYERVTDLLTDDTYLDMRSEMFGED